jgi:hypothetical protein
MSTVPVNPFSEVRVMGIDPLPLEGMVMLLAEILKPGAGAAL